MGLHFTAALYTVKHLFTQYDFAVVVRKQPCEAMMLVLQRVVSQLELAKLGSQELAGMIAAVRSHKSARMCARKCIVLNTPSVSY